MLHWKIYRKPWLNPSFIRGTTPCRHSASRMRATLRASAIPWGVKSLVMPRGILKMCLSISKWMFPKIGGFPPKMDGENHGKTYEQMDDLGGIFPLFLVQHPNGDEHEKYFKSLPGTAEIISQWGGSGAAVQPRVQPSRKKVKCMDHNVCIYIYNICNDIFIINTYDICITNPEHCTFKSKSLTSLKHVMHLNVFNDPIWVIYWTFVSPALLCIYMDLLHSNQQICERPGEEIFRTWLKTNGITASKDRR